MSPGQPLIFRNLREVSGPWKILYPVIEKRKSKKFIKVKKPMTRLKL